MPYSASCELSDLATLQCLLPCMTVGSESDKSAYNNKPRMYADGPKLRYHQLAAALHESKRIVSVEYRPNLVSLLFLFLLHPTTADADIRLALGSRDKQRCKPSPREKAAQLTEG